MAHDTAHGTPDKGSDEISPHAHEDEVAQGQAYDKVEVITKPKPESIANLSDEELAIMEKTMVRKVDLVVMPIIGILYILNYVDRSGLAATHVYGITEDLHMSETDFATAISILFVSYIPMQFPSNILISRIPRPGLYICCMATLWGAVSACTAAVKTKESLYAVRVILGIAEAAYFPGALYFLSAWYKKEELAKRIGGVFMFQALGQALGGFIAAACLTLEGRYGIAGWRWLFIVEGTVTVGLGIIFAMIMPEFPHNARMLTPTQRDLAVWRLENERGAAEAHEESTAWDGLRAAVSDKKLWLLVWCGGMGQAMGSVFNFFPSIIASLKYAKYESLLLTVPPYVVAMIGYYATSFLSDKYNQMYFLVAVNVLISVPVYILGMLAPNVGSRYFAMCLMPVVSVAPQVMLYKSNGLHMARPATKRALGMALINGLGGLSNVWTSYLWAGGGPQYFKAFGTLLGCAIVFFISITGYKFWVLHLNRKLAGTPEEQADVMRKHYVSQEQVDMGWRYEGYDSWVLSRKYR